MTIDVIIGGVQYKASPLKLKHLRQISEMLTKGITPPKTVFEDISPWMPYVFECIQANHPEFDIKLLEELTAQDFFDMWIAIANNSGVKLSGEQMPIQQTGQQSTVTSAVASA